MRQTQKSTKMMAKDPLDRQVPHITREPEHQPLGQALTIMLIPLQTVDKDDQDLDRLFVANHSVEALADKDHTQANKGLPQQGSPHSFHTDEQKEKGRALQ